MAQSFASVELWDPTDYFCERDWCPAVLESGEVIFTDSIHWSLEASRFVYSPIDDFIRRNT